MAFGGKVADNRKAVHVKVLIWAELTSVFSTR